MAEMVTNYLEGIFNRRQERDKFKINFLIALTAYAQRLRDKIKSNPRRTNCQEENKEHDYIEARNSKLKRAKRLHNKESTSK